MTRTEYETASGFMGKLRGYLPDRWPARFAPRLLELPSEPFGPFPQSMSRTDAGDVRIVMLAGAVDGVAPDPGKARETLDRIRRFTEDENVVYLPAHDPHATERLEARRPARPTAR